MEEASGDALNVVWPTLAVAKKFTVVDQILSLQDRLLWGGAELGGYGSLYFTEDAIALGCQSSYWWRGRLLHVSALGRSQNVNFWTRV
jgi:hypothetical protein